MKKHNYIGMVIILSIAIVIFMLIDNYFTKQAIEQCVKKGNDYDYCLVKLS